MRDCLHAILTIWKWYRSFGLVGLLTWNMKSFSVGALLSCWKLGVHSWAYIVHWRSESCWSSLDVQQELLRSLFVFHAIDKLFRFYTCGRWTMMQQS